jgi:hypothetical protein
MLKESHAALAGFVCVRERDGSFGQSSAAEGVKAQTI